jgi:hypothetical protein
VKEFIETKDIIEILQNVIELSKGIKESLGCLGKDLANEELLFLPKLQFVNSFLSQQWSTVLGEGFRNTGNSSGSVTKR